MRVRELEWGPSTLVSPPVSCRRLGHSRRRFIDEEGDRLLAYPELGISFLSCDREEQMRLTNYELDPNSDAELWGIPLFRSSRAVIAQSMATRGLLFVRNGDSSEGEILFQVGSEGLDFYFEGDRLTALNAGVVFATDDTIQWSAARLV